MSALPADWRLLTAAVQFQAQQPGGVEPQRALLIGQKLAAGTATADILVRILDANAAVQLFGRASHLERMARAFIAINPYMELWALPLADGAVDQATGTLTFGGAATADGKISLYIAGKLIEVEVVSGQAAAAIATAVNAAILADLDLPVTPTDNLAGVLTLTARHKGTIGNRIPVIANLLGIAGGQQLPAGVTLSITLMGGAIPGGLDPSITTAITNLGDLPFRYIVAPYHPNTSSTLLDALTTEMERRADPLVAAYGHVFTAVDGTSGDLATWGNAQNDRYRTCFGIKLCPTPVYEIAAIAAATIARSVSDDPARPVHNRKLTGVMAPTEGARFTEAELNLALYDGITPLRVDQAGAVRLCPWYTTYQKNDAGGTDWSYASGHILATLFRIAEDVVSDLESAYPQYKLVSDDTKITSGQYATQPRGIRGRLAALGRKWAHDIWIQDPDEFVARLQVSVDPSDANRVLVTAEPALAGQLTGFDVVVGFFTQYPQEG